MMKTCNLKNVIKPIFSRSSVRGQKQSEPQTQSLSSSFNMNHVVRSSKRWKKSEREQKKLPRVQAWGRKAMETTSQAQDSILILLLCLAWPHRIKSMGKFMLYSEFYGPGKDINPAWELGVKAEKSLYSLQKKGL